MEAGKKVLFKALEELDLDRVLITIRHQNESDEVFFMDVEPETMAKFLTALDVRYELQA